MKKVLFILFALLTTTVININADVNGPSPSYAAEREGYSKMYVTAQNQDAHISMVIEDQNFMEYTITSVFIVEVHGFTLLNMESIKLFP